VSNPVIPAVGGTQDLFCARSERTDLPTIVGGEGLYLFDDRGRRILDVCSGPFLANLGQGNERVLGAMQAQSRRLTYTYSRGMRRMPNCRPALRRWRAAASSECISPPVALRPLRWH
jgi:4-aminobutyrate aminotransferase-like enzyme